MSVSERRKGIVIDAERLASEWVAVVETVGGQGDGVRALIKGARWMAIPAARAALRYMAHPECSDIEYDQSEVRRIFRVGGGDRTTACDHQLA